jgi:hypothetical protein
MTEQWFREEVTPRHPTTTILPPAGADSGWTPLLVFLLGVTVIAAAGCYRPSITDGGLLCAATNPACPDGYSCVDGRCHRQTQGDASVAPDTTGDRPVNPDATGDADAGATKDTGPDLTIDADAAMCVARQALDGCTPQTGVACDPVCQTVCCTDEKCTALNSGSAATMTASLGCSKLDATRRANDTCDVKNAGTTARSDNCQAGLLCVTGDSDSICFKMCRDDLDCPGGARCEMRRLEPNSMYQAAVCGLPPSTCNPTGQAICPDGRTCYLITSDKDAGDRTVCDISSGAKGNAASCTYAFECLPGWTCPATGLPGAGRCQPVCAHGGTSSPTSCPRTLTCQTNGKDFDLCL